MTEPSLPKSIADLVGARIHSIEQLEVLLLLWRSSPETWTARRASTTLRLDETLVQGALGALAQHSLLQAAGPDTGSFAYAPATAELAQQVDELAAHHA